MDQKEIKHYKKIQEIIGLLDGYSVAEAQALLHEAGGFIGSFTRFNINAAELVKEFEVLNEPPSE